MVRDGMITTKRIDEEVIVAVFDERVSIQIEDERRRQRLDERRASARSTYSYLQERG